MLNALIWNTLRAINVLNLGGDGAEQPELHWKDSCCFQQEFGICRLYINVQGLCKTAGKGGLNGAPDQAHYSKPWSTVSFWTLKGLHRPSDYRQSEVFSWRFNIRVEPSRQPNILPFGKHLLEELTHKLYRFISYFMWEFWTAYIYSSPNLLNRVPDKGQLVMKFIVVNL